jgi:hypothetical protein
MQGAVFFRRSTAVNATELEFGNGGRGREEQNSDGTEIMFNCSVHLETGRGRCGWY